MKVLILRTDPGASFLAKKLRRCNHRTLIEPLLRIERLADNHRIRATIQQIDHYDDIISTSVHASQALCDWLQGRRSAGPIRANWLAAGIGSARALAPVAAEVKAPPDGSGSRGLLALDCLRAIGGRSILIAHGEGGTQTLPEVLTARGAKVTQLVLYKRLPNTAAQARLAECDPDDFDALDIASGAVLDALCATRPVRDWRGIGLAPSARVAALARKAGFGCVKNCRGASPDLFALALSKTTSN